MQGKHSIYPKTLAFTMYKKSQQSAQIKIPFAEFSLPFHGTLDGSNRWIQLTALIPWEKFEDQYSKNFSKGMGANALSFRIALGALIIKARLNLTDREAVEQIQENPYLQYFLGYQEFKTTAPFDASLYVHFRKRISHEILAKINETIVLSALSKSEETEKDNNDDDKKNTSDNASVEEHKKEQDIKEPEPLEGKLIIDSTCTPADIRFPTDYSLLNEAREKTEKIIDCLWKDLKAKQSFPSKPRTYRKEARKNFLATIKRKRLSDSQRRKVIRIQLNYVKRNLTSIAPLKEFVLLTVLSKSLYKSLLVVQELYRQQSEMYQEKKRSISDRIVSITQPHVRPIVRGKAGKPVEFGAKLSASVIKGYTFIDRLCWDAYNEGSDLQEQAHAYKKRFGHFPQSIHADKIYRNRDNMRWCKTHNIRLSGPALGRPKKVTTANKAELKQARQLTRQDEIDRICIEGKFGQSKRRFSLSRVMAKLPITSESVISMVILVMNLEKLMTQFLFSVPNRFVLNMGRMIIRVLNEVKSYLQVYRYALSRGVLELAMD